MEPSDRSRAVVNVEPEAWRQYADAHSVGEYAIIDVRQVEEYREGHVPGALLIPLGELTVRAKELEAFRGRSLLFYCRSGGRSSRAAAWAAQALSLPNVMNLSGGFMNWNGVALPEFPRLQGFDLGGSIEALLNQALELEKGTHRLYELLATSFTTGPVGAVIASLAQAEMAHGRAIHGVLRELGGDVPEDFERLFEELEGNLIESGESYSEVVARARELGEYGESALLELALEIELQAYDLYSNLASRAEPGRARDSLEKLADQEKQHANAVMNAIGELIARR